MNKETESVLIWVISDAIVAVAFPLLAWYVHVFKGIEGIESIANMDLIFWWLKVSVLFFVGHAIVTGISIVMMSQGSDLNPAKNKMPIVLAKYRN